MPAFTRSTPYYFAWCNADQCTSAYGLYQSQTLKETLEVASARHRVQRRPAPQIEIVFVRVPQAGENIDGHLAPHQLFTLANRGVVLL